MLLQSRDTTLKAELAQIDMIRKAGPARRVAQMLSLSSSVINLSKRAIQRANPDFSKEESDIAFVEVHYGPALARAVAGYLAARKRK